VTAELPIIVRERLEDAYSLSAYYLSKLVAELPFEQLYPLVFVSISYWMVGLRPAFINFFVFVCIVAASNFAAGGLGMAVSVGVGDVRAASVLVNIVILLLYASNSPQIGLILTTFFFFLKKKVVDCRVLHSNKPHPRLAELASIWLIC